MSDSLSLRLATKQKRDDYASMDEYSADTRVELTALGWRCVFDNRQKEGVDPTSKRKQAEAKRASRPRAVERCGIERKRTGGSLRNQEYRTSEQ